MKNLVDIMNKYFDETRDEVELSNTIGKLNLLCDMYENDLIDPDMEQFKSIINDFKIIIYSWVEQKIAEYMESIELNNLQDKINSTIEKFNTSNDIKLDIVDFSIKINKEDKQKENRQNITVESTEVSESTIIDDEYVHIDLTKQIGTYSNILLYNIYPKLEDIYMQPIPESKKVAEAKKLLFKALRESNANINYASKVERDIDMCNDYNDIRKLVNTIIDNGKNFKRKR